MNRALRANHTLSLGLPQDGDSLVTPRRGGSSPNETAPRSRCERAARYALRVEFVSRQLWGVAFVWRPPIFLKEDRGAFDQRPERKKSETPFLARLAIDFVTA